MLKSKAMLVVGVLVLLAIIGVVWWSMGTRSVRGGGGLDRPEVTASTGAKAAAGHANAFGFKLFNEVVKGKEQDNVALSGASAAMALAMVHEGCDGESRRVLAEALGYPGKPDGEMAKAFADLMAVFNGRTVSTVRMANAVYVRPDVKVLKPFSDTVTGTFGAHLKAIDLNSPESVREINEWASRQTGGMIPTFIDRPEMLSEDLLVRILNAVYFDGLWETPFDADDTSPADFHPETGETFKVPMMSGKVESELDSWKESMGVLRLPYKGGDYSMVLILPLGEKKLADVRAELAGGVWPEVWGELGRRTRETNVRVPRFKHSDHMDLKQGLIGMGLGAVVEQGKADFSRIDERFIAGGLMYGEFRQKVKIEVDEQGTRAAAVTEFDGAEKKAGPAFDPNFNRPFLYMIVEKQTGAILFLGQVTDPRKE